MSRARTRRLTLALAVPAGAALRRLLCFAALGSLAVGAAAQTTYTSASTAFSWIDASAHTKVGYNTTPYKFNASTGCGTTPPVLDDTLSDSIPLGFTFRFGTTDFTSAYVMTNGRLQFGNTTCGAGTSNIGPPQTYPYGYPDAGMNATMKAFGVDLDPTNLVDKPNYPSSGAKTPCASITTCYVSVATIGTAPSRQFVVTWKGVPEWVTAANTSGTFDLQIIVNEGGSFVYQYGTISHGGTGTAQIGWQLATTDYQVLSFGAATEPAANTAIAFYIPAPVAAYRFDEGAWVPGLAGQVADSSGNARPGIAVGSAQTTGGGKLCRGANIPLNTTAAQVDAVKLADISNASLNLLGSGTVAFWYKANTAWNSGQAAQLMDAATQSGEWFYLARSSTGTLVFAVQDSTGTLRSVETAAQTFAANTWVHVVLSWNFNGLAGSNQDNLRVAINAGTPTLASFTSSGTVTTSVGAIYLGDNALGAADTRGTVNSANGVMDEAQIFNYVLSDSQVDVLIAATRTCTTLSFDHLELQSTGSGLTCTPSTITVRACANAACSSLYTSGVAAIMTATGGPTTQFDSSTGNGSGGAFVIPSGSGTVTKGVQVTTVGTTVLGTTGVTVTTSGATTCNFGSPSCSFSAADSGLLFNVPDHASEAAQAVNVSAVRKADNAAVCIPAFASVSKNVTFTCGTTNPSTGTLPVRVGGRALNSANNSAAVCDSTGQAVSLAFNASGVASTTVQYADVGQMLLSARYTGSGGDAGLVMLGSDSFIAAPASFAFSGITAAPIKAGSAFAASVAARNSSGNTTPNFGRETAPATVTLSHTRAQPTGTAASNGSFTGSVGAFTSGVASGSNLVWSEVGKIDLTATLTGANYLGSGLTASGNTGSAGAVGRFIPHHFDVVVTPFCSGFTYAAQPFGVRVTAMNGLASPTPTVNYDGSANTSPNFAQAVTLSDATSPALGVGTFGGNAVTAATFGAGVANTALPAYTYTSKITTEKTLPVRAIDVDGASSLGYAEGSTLLRSGRLRLSNAFGSEKSPLAMTVQAQYWGGNAWVKNSSDSCTSVPAASVVLSGYLDNKGAATTAWSTTASTFTLLGGERTITLSAPSPTATGSVDVALNLGSSGVDQSCLSAHPASTSAARAWLRSQNGGCSALWDRDPSARASFGIYTPETRKTTHVRDIF